MKTILLVMAGIYLQSSVRAQDSSLLHKNSSPLTRTDTTIRVSDSSSINVDSTINRMLQRLNDVKKNQEQNSEVIYGLLQGNRIDNKTKYELIKSNLINASTTYRLLNKGINDLKSKAAINDLTLFIHSLSKPDNKELGFSFDTQIMKMVTDILLEGKSLRSRKSKKIIASTNSILKSPIFRRVTSISPSLGMANSIMTFFRSEEVQKYINNKNLKNFEQQLNRYVTYYKALNGADSKFNQELTFREDQLSSLQVKLYYSLEFIGSPLGVEFPDTSEGKPIGEVLDNYFTRFTTEDVVQYFNKLEKKYTSDDQSKINYELLLRDNMRLKEVNNNLESLVLNGKKFENLYNSYLDLIDNYCTQVSATLDVAGNYEFATQEMVTREKNTLAGLKVSTTQAIQDSINIKALQTNLDQIKYQQKIF